VEIPREGPTPTYAEELLRLQRAGVRLAGVIAAILILCFAGLDRLVAPEAWISLLWVRAVASALLLVCAQLALQPRTSPLAIAGLEVALIVGAIEIALIRIGGGAANPYLVSVVLVQAGLTILIPLRPWHMLALNVEVIAIALLPIFPTLRSGWISISYLIAMGCISVTGSGLQDRLRRREHMARAEFARHFGLLNLGTLAGGLAHELSNPLMAIGMQVEMLEKAPITAQRIEQLRGQVDRMRNILEAMRSGARLSGGERRLVDLTREADLAFTLLESRLRNKASLVRAYAEMPPVYCQPTLLGQVLVNLLANAADAVTGRPEARIALRVRREGKEALVEVEDNGPGVPAELRTKIFEPFFSTKGEKGNGLGLWISSEIARVHGGALTVQQGSSGGALFRLSLPIDART
jgi:signal transduction histidine kinase